MLHRSIRTVGFLTALILAALSAPLSASAVNDEWHALGSNGAGGGALTESVKAIAVIGNNVFVAGSFVNAAGIATADYIARWNGNSWSALGTNGGGNGALNSQVNAMAVIGNDLYVGGTFVDAAGIATADYIAKWNGSTWSSVGSNGSGNGALNFSVNALDVSGSNLYVGGQFTNAGNVATADYFARWNGSAWSGVGSLAGNGPVANTVWDMEVEGSSLYVVGAFSNVGGVDTADVVARWNGSTWSGVGSDGSGHGILGSPFSNVGYAIAVDGSNVYVGGNFVNIGGDPIADYLVGWNGSTWSRVGSNGAAQALSTIVYALTFADGLLYAGGHFTGAGGDTTADYLGVWNGSTWAGLGSNAAGTDGALSAGVYAITADGPHIYAGGNFANAAGVATADRVARFGPVMAYQPDGRIKKGTGSLVGNNIYNQTGDNQARSGGKGVGGTITFTISVQNDGTDEEQLSVYSTGAFAANFEVTYWQGTTNITGQVVTGTYRTPYLNPGATFAIQAKVKVLAGATVGSSVTRLVSLTSVADPSKVDVVRFTGKRK